MITDAVMEAITEMINQADSDHEKDILLSVRYMLSDFNEDEWNYMDDEDRRMWIRSYR